VIYRISEEGLLRYNDEKFADRHRVILGVLMGLDSSWTTGTAIDEVMGALGLNKQDAFMDIQELGDHGLIEEAK